MIDRLRLVTPHFRLGELVVGWEPDSIPTDVMLNLEHTCILLEAIRFHFGLPMVIDSGYRSRERNAGAKGVRQSDLLSGSAADFKVRAGHGMSWEANTKAAFEFARTHLGGKFGQLILEDHRTALGDAEALWVHIAIPSLKHPGFGDVSAVLYSPAPDVYQAWAA